MDLQVDIRQRGLQVDIRQEGLQVDIRQGGLQITSRQEGFMFFKFFFILSVVTKSKEKI